MIDKSPTFNQSPSYWFKNLLLNRFSQQLIKLYPTQGQINLSELYQIQKNQLDPSRLINNIYIFYEDIINQKKLDLIANFPETKKNFYLEGLIEQSGSTHLINQNKGSVNLKDLYFIYSSVKKIKHFQLKDHTQ